MPECKYRLCHVIFEPGGKGNKKKYYCTQHRDNERYRLRMDKQFLAINGVSKEECQAAREQAILNCADYLGCLNIAYRVDGDMNCHNCSKPTTTDAWKHEPGVLIYDGVDYGKATHKIRRL